MSFEMPDIQETHVDGCDTLLSCIRRLPKALVDERDAVQALLLLFGRELALVYLLPDSHQLRVPFAVSDIPTDCVTIVQT